MRGMSEVEGGVLGSVVFAPLRVELTICPVLSRY